MIGNETLLVGYAKTSENNTAILIIGRKQPGETTELINWFEGTEAEELYAKLVTKKEARP